MGHEGVVVRWGEVESASELLLLIDNGMRAMLALPALLERTAKLIDQLGDPDFVSRFHAATYELGLGPWYDACPAVTDRSRHREPLEAADGLASFIPTGSNEASFEHASFGACLLRELLADLERAMRATRADVPGWLVVPAEV